MEDSRDVMAFEEDDWASLPQSDETDFWTRFRNWVTRFFHIRCTNTEIRFRRINIDQKNNCPPIIYKEAKRVCLDCSTIVESAYLPEGEEEQE